MKYKKNRCQSQNSLDPRLLRERERERGGGGGVGGGGGGGEHMVPLKLFHIILTSMLYKQLSGCTLLLWDVK